MSAVLVFALLGVFLLFDSVYLLTERCRRQSQELAIAVLREYLDNPCAHDWEDPPPFEPHYPVTRAETDFAVLGQICSKCSARRIYNGPGAAEKFTYL